MTYLLIFLAVIGFQLTNGFDINDCKQLTLNAVKLEKEINVTERYLRTPEEYKDVADKCKEVYNCIKPGGEEARKAIDNHLSQCHFYIFYNGEFQECAHKLIAEKDSKVDCLNVLFNDECLADVDDCDLWEGQQKCIKQSILDFCDDKDEKLQKKWEEESLNLRPTICVADNDKSDEED